MIWNNDKIKEIENLIDFNNQNGEQIKSTINILYLFGRYTLDEYIFKMLYRENKTLFDELEPLKFDINKLRI